MDPVKVISWCYYDEQTPSNRGTQFPFQGFEERFTAAIYRRKYTEKVPTVVRIRILVYIIHFFCDLEVL